MTTPNRPKGWGHKSPNPKMAALDLGTYNGIPLTKAVENKTFYHLAQSARFISAVCKRLRLPGQATALAQVFLHKFYIAAPRHENYFSIATACVFLASKSAETLRRIRDVINVSSRVQNPEEPPIEVDNDFWVVRDALTEQEQVVLRTLSFRLDTTLPHCILMNHLHSLNASPDLAQASLAVLQDLFLVRQCVEYPPHVLSAACIYFASRLLKMPLPVQAWTVFQVQLASIERISEALLMLYNARFPEHSRAPGPLVVFLPEGIE